MTHLCRAQGGPLIGRTGLFPQHSTFLQLLHLPMEFLPSSSNTEHKAEGMSNQMAITQMEEDVLIFQSC